MDMNHGAGWGGSSGNNRYGGTGYGSGWVVIVVLIILCPLLILGWLFIGDRDVSEPKNLDTMSEQHLRHLFVASVKTARISYLAAMKKDAPYTDGEVEAMAAGNDFSSMRHAIEIADKINFGKLSPADMEQMMRLLDAIFQNVKVQINQTMNNDEKKHKKKRKRSKNRSSVVLLSGDNESDIVQTSENSQDPAKNNLQPNGPTVEDFRAIQSGSNSDSAAEGGLGGEEAAPEAANTDSENNSENEEDEADSGEAPQKLTKEAVKDVFRQNVGNFRSCYQKTLEQNPDVSGKILFKFIVNQEGNVQDIAVLETGPSLRDAQMELHNPEMEDCLRENLKNMNFPKFQTSNSDGNISVTFPMVFRTTDE